MGNIYKVVSRVSREVLKEKFGTEHKFFQKRTADCYIQNQFYSYIDNEAYRIFLLTELKQTYQKGEIFKSEES